MHLLNKSVAYLTSQWQRNRPVALERLDSSGLGGHEIDLLLPHILSFAQDCNEKEYKKDQTMKDLGKEKDLKKDQTMKDLGKEKVDEEEGRCRERLSRELEPAHTPRMTSGRLPNRSSLPSSVPHVSI